MYKNITCIITIIMILNGCASYDVLKLGNIDNNDKSIIVPSSGVLSMMEIKRMLIKNGWKMKASYDGVSSVGTIKQDINIKTTNYSKARYRMFITETNRMEQFVLTISISIIDNKTQTEVLSLFGNSMGAGGVFPSSTAKELEKALQDIERI
jgi:hypothetical protein